jgi:hypothetical protein
MPIFTIGNIGNFLGDFLEQNLLYLQFLSMTLHFGETEWDGRMDERTDVCPLYI